MFVKRTVKRYGETTYEYLTLVEAVRREGKLVQRTLFRLGEVSELRESGQLDRIVKSLAAYTKAPISRQVSSRASARRASARLRPSGRTSVASASMSTSPSSAMAGARECFPTQCSRWWPTV